MLLPRKQPLCTGWHVTLSSCSHSVTTYGAVSASLGVANTRCGSFSCAREVLGTLLLALATSTNSDRQIAAPARYVSLCKDKSDISDHDGQVAEIAIEEKKNDRLNRGFAVAFHG